MPEPLRQAPGRLLRWGGVILLVLLLHTLAAQWLNRQKIALTQSPATPTPIEILLQPRTIQRIASPGHAARSPDPAPAAPAVAPVRQAAHPTHEAAALHALSTQASAPAVASAASAVSEASAPDAPQTAVIDSASAARAAYAAARAAASAQPKPPAPAQTPPSSANQNGERFALPPAADLRYDTFMNGVQNMPGTISWLTNGDHYSLVVSLPIPFIGKFTYMSQGHVDAFGLAPERYTEQRGSHPADETRFERHARQITFSRTPAVLPLPNGAQDRFSMVFQLASLVRGDPARYTPGITRVFFVVDNDSGENWPVETLASESIRVGNGYVSALHFTRLPRHAGDRRKIDVWLAPSLGYFPVRIVQTEPSGTQVELLLHDAPHRLEALAADAAGDQAAGASAAASGPASGTTTDHAADNAPSPAFPQTAPPPREHP